MNLITAISIIAILLVAGTIAYKLIRRKKNSKSNRDFPIEFDDGVDESAVLTGKTAEERSRNDSKYEGNW